MSPYQVGLAAEAGSGPPPFLTELVALLVAAAVIGYACARLRIVPIVGFLLAGVLIGPNALGRRARARGHRRRRRDRRDPAAVHDRHRVLARAG